MINSNLAYSVTFIIPRGRRYYRLWLYICSSCRIIHTHTHSHTWLMRALFPWPPATSLIYAVSFVKFVRIIALTADCQRERSFSPVKTPGRQPGNRAATGALLTHSLTHAPAASLSWRMNTENEECAASEKINVFYFNPFFMVYYYIQLRIIIWLINIEPNNKLNEIRNVQRAPHKPDFPFIGVPA